MHEFVQFLCCEIGIWRGKIWILQPKRTDYSRMIEEIVMVHLSRSCNEVNGRNCITVCIGHSLGRSQLHLLLEAS